LNEDSISLVNNHSNSVLNPSSNLSSKSNFIGDSIPLSNFASIPTENGPNSIPNCGSNSVSKEGLNGLFSSSETQTDDQVRYALKL
jgi:hypothetical protein